jgi:hypothetical protein
VTKAGGISVSLILVALCLSGCREIVDPPSGPPLFSIDLQSAFNRDTVRVTLDGAVIFQDTVTTSPLLGLGHRFSPQISRGSHTLGIDILNGSVDRDTAFNFSDTLTVAVNYDRTAARIMFTMYRSILYYR